MPVLGIYLKNRSLINSNFQTILHYSIGSTLTNLVVIFPIMNQKITEEINHPKIPCIWDFRHKEVKSKH